MEELISLFSLAALISVVHFSSPWQTFLGFWAYKFGPNFFYQLFSCAVCFGFWVALVWQLLIVGKTLFVALPEAGLVAFLAGTMRKYLWDVVAGKT